MATSPGTLDGRFWNCSIARCPNASAIDSGGCERCSRHFCIEHIRSSLHNCSENPLDDAEWLASQGAELEALREKINVQDLLGIASNACGGLECSVEELDRPFGASLVGGMHAHLRIRFTNGSSWLARVPRENFTSFSDQLTNALLLSECATLKWLEGTKVPSPRLHGYGLRNDPGNTVGVAFLLIDELPGQPFMQTEPTEDQTRSVYRQWLDIQTELSQHPLDHIGCLTFGSDKALQVGPVVGDRAGTLDSLGRFDDATSYYAAWADEYLRLIAERQLFGRSSSHAYLVFKYLKQVAAEGRCNGFEQHLNQGPFFLKHMDDKGDHILVDSDFNITGVIDWSFARAVPAYEAFGPSLFTADLGDILSGKPGLGQNDLLMASEADDSGSPLARFARSDDRVRRFMFGLGTGMGLNAEELTAVSKGLVDTFEDGSEPVGWDAWRVARTEEWAHDECLRAIFLREQVDEA